jgi:nitric oxide dioxygenase
LTDGQFGEICRKILQRFFETTPDARRLFPDDMERLHLKLMDTMAAIVGALNNDTLCRSIISHTARQHRRIGVTSLQLAAFRDALIWTLQQQIGKAFTPALKEAWIALYKEVQTEMINTANIQV